MLFLIDNDMLQCHWHPSCCRYCAASRPPPAAHNSSRAEVALLQRRSERLRRQFDAVVLEVEALCDE